MQKTAIHLLLSLEMRMLANHGTNKRFAFLKGRWNHAWLITKAKVRAEKERKVKQERVNGLRMLAGYDSGSDKDKNKVNEKMTWKTRRKRA